MSNRERVLEASLSLFNDQGTAAVSTNHIAGAAKISPGNLYYHFRSKEDIIRALFERLFSAWDETFQLPTDRAPTLADMEALISANYRLIWEFRFAYRELAVLLRNDPSLQSRYREVRQRGYEGFAGLIEAFSTAGVLRNPAGPQELNSLTELCWMLSEQWPINLELNGQPFDEQGIQAGAELMRLVLRPLITGSTG